MELENIGIAPPPYRPPQTGYNKDEPAYAALIESSETEEPATSLFDTMETEILNYGYSSLVDKVKEKWVLEQDAEKQQVVTNLIDDPTIDVEFKKTQLRKYLTDVPFMSTELKDKWTKDLNDEYIVENNLQSTDSFIAADNEVGELQTEQSFEQIKDSIEAADAGEIQTPPDFDTFSTRFNRILDTWKEFGTYNLNPTEADDPGYIPVWDDLAFLASMVYHTPDYFIEITQTWDQASSAADLRSLRASFFTEITGLDKLLPTMSSDEAGKQLIENRKRTFTEIREGVQEQRKTALTKEIAEGLDWSLRQLGMDVQANSIAKMPFDLLGEAIDAAAKSSKDPGKTALMLETVLLFALPYAIHKIRQPKKKPFRFEKEVKSVVDPALENITLPTSTITSAGIVVPINYNPTGRVSLKGNPVKAQFNKETLEITVDAELIKKTFPKVPARAFIVDGIVTWRNPAIPEQQKQIEDFEAFGEFEIVINTPEEYVQFIVEHEIAHVTNLQLPEESKANYEARINRSSYESFNAKRYKDIQKVMPAEGNPKVNTPLVTTNIANPTAGIEMWTEILRNPDTLPKVGLNPEQLLLKMYDPVDNVYKANNIGPVPDATYIAQIARAKKAEDMMALLDPADPHVALKREYIFKTLELNEQIIKDYPVVQAPSLDILQGTGTGFNYGVAYRKSIVENFKSPQEVMRVYNAIKAKILNTRKAKELLPEQSLEIHEVLDRDGSFQPIEVYKDGIIPEERLNRNTTSSFIIRWNEKTSFTEFFDNELTRTPEELYSNSIVGGFFPKATIRILPGSSPSIGGPTAYWNMSIGRFPKEVEQHYRQSMLRVQQYGDQQRKIMLKNVVARLGKTDQIMLDKVLDAARQLQMDYPTLELIQDVLPPMKLERQLRIQRAAHNFRMFLNSMYRFQSSEAYNVLTRSGYNQQFILKDPRTGVPQVLPVMENFMITPDNVIAVGPDGNIYNIMVYHSDYQGMRLITVNKQHMHETGKVFNFENGMPKEQIFRASHIIEDPNTPLEVKSDYVMSNTFKPQPLQTNVIPYIPGHIPRINTDSNVIVAIPYKVVRNGITSNFMDSKGNTPNIGTVKEGLVDLSEQNLSQKVSEAKSELITAHEQYGRVVGTFESLKNAQEFSSMSLNKMKQMYPNHVFIVRLGKDLQAQTVRLHYEAEANTAMSGSLRGNLLHWDTADGPLKSTLIKSHTTGKKYLNDLAVTRMEEMYVKLYVKPGAKGKVTITPNPKHSVRTDKSNAFPVSRDQIKKKAEMQAEFDQALALYDQIVELRQGVPNRVLANIVFNTAKGIADKLENNSGFLKSINTNPVIIALRRTQRGSKEIEGALDRAITFLSIRLNPFNMLLVQSPAALANLFVYGQDGPLYNPIKVAENFRDSSRLFMMAMRLGFKEKATDKAVWDALDKYMEMGELVNLPESKKGFFGYKEKISSEELMFILYKAKEIGFLDVTNHEMMTSLFANKMIELGEGQTSWNTSPEGLKDLTYRLLNPANTLKRATKLSGDVYIASEAFSRIPQIIVSVHDWQAKNPGKSWKTTEAMTEIFMNADQLAGSMHRYARFNYSKTTVTAALGKFAIYVDKQREMVTNERARIGTAKEAWAAAGLWAGLTGTAVFGMFATLTNALETIYDAFFEDDDIEKNMKTWDKFALLDYGLEYLMTGEWGEGDRLMIGEKISPYGSKEMAWGFKGTVYALFVYAILGDQGGNVNKGITISLLEKVFGPRGTLPTIMSLYFNPMLDSEEKAKVAVTLVSRYVPFIRNLDATEQQLILDDLSTKTGHALGIGGTKSDIFIRGLLGVQTKDQQTLWEIVNDDTKRRKEYQTLAKQSAEVFFVANQERATIQDLKDHTVAWVHLLKEQGLVVDTQQALEFIAEFESVIKRQDEALVNTLADKEIADLVMQELYDPTTVDKLLKLSEIQKNKGQYLDSEKTMNRAKYMIKINKEYQEQQQGNK